MRNTSPSFFIKIKPLQAVLDAPAVLKLSELLEQSTDFQCKVYEEDKDETPTITPTTLNTVYYPDIRLELQDLEIICPLSKSTKKPLDNEVVCHVSLITVSSNPDNLLSRVIIDKGYHKHIKSTDTHARCNYQLQIELTGLEVYSDRISSPEIPQNITNAAEAWGQRKLSSCDEISATIIQGLDMRVTYAPSVMATRSGSKFGIYGSSMEMHVDPLKVQLAVDQIELLLLLANQLPSQSGATVTVDRSSKSVNKVDCYETMFAVNHLTLLLYERVPVAGDQIPGPEHHTTELELLSLLECSVEQGVLSACSLPAGDVIRASLFTATLAISTHSTGVHYDGDLKCPVKVFSTIPPNRHTPFITLCRENNYKTDKLKIEVKHDVEVEAEISYLDPLLSAARKLGGLQSAGEDATEPPAPSSSFSSSSSSVPSSSSVSLPLDHIILHVQQTKVRVCELEVGFKSLDLSLGRELNKSIRSDLELSGVHASTTSDSLSNLDMLLPCDVKITTTIDTKGVVNSVYLPCVYCKLGQEHVTVLHKLADQISKYLPVSVEGPSPAPFTTYHHDDIRSAGYKFVILESDKQHIVAPGTVVFSANEAAITWRYPEKRSIVTMVTLPVLLACEQNEGIQCTLLYYDQFTKSYIPYIDFVVSQVDVATFKLPSGGMQACQWRVHMELDVEIWEEKSSGSDTGDDVVLDWKDVELSSYPALSLAGCLCVDSVSTRAPSISTSLYTSELQFVLLHHNLKHTDLWVYDLPLVLPDRELELLKVTARNLSARTDIDTALSVQVRCSSDVHYLDYSTLLYTLVARSQLHASFMSRDTSQGNDVTPNVTVVTSRPTKTTVSLCLDSTSLSLSPALLPCLNSVKRSWGDQLSVSLFETFVVNETSYSAQLMLNGSRYVSCEGKSTVACYWNPAKPVFVALENIHPSWSRSIDLVAGSVVEDNGMFIIVERKGGCNYIRITGGLCVNNRTVLNVQCSFLPLDPSRGETTYSTLQVQSIGAGEVNKSFVLGPGEHAMSFSLNSDTVQWSQPVRLHKDLSESFVVSLSPECYIVASILHNTGHFTVTLNPLFIVRNNFAEDLLISLSSPEQGLSKTVKLAGFGEHEQIFSINQTSYHNIGCKLDASMPLSMPVSSLSYRLLDKLPARFSDQPWPSSIHSEPPDCEIRSILVPHSEIEDWSLEAEIHLSRDPVSKHTMCVDWWPGCLVHNNTTLTVAVRGSLSSPPVVLKPVSHRSTFSLKGQLYVGIKEESTGETVWTTMINITAKRGETQIFREVHIAGQDQSCHVIVHCEYKGSVTMVTIKPSLVLSVKLPQLYVKLGEKVVLVDEEYSTDLYWWGNEMELEMAYKQSTNWSSPLNLTSLAPRKGVNVMSDKPCNPVPVVVCSVDHTATTYVTVTYNTSPQIYLTNNSEFEFLVSERLPPTLTPTSVVVDGDKTLLLKPFRSCYFDPYSTTDKLFIQDISENDFIPQLSFAFYRRSQEAHDTLINSHRIELDSRSRDTTSDQSDDLKQSRDFSSSDRLEIIKIDEDNKVGIRVRNEDNLVTVSIMSEFMVESRRTTKRSREGSPRDMKSSRDMTSSDWSYSLAVSQIDMFLFTEINILASQIRLSNVACSLAPDRAHACAADKSRDSATVPTPDTEDAGHQSLTFLIDDIQIDNSLRDQTYDYLVVLFTDKAVRAGSSPEPFLKTSVTFNNTQQHNTQHNTHAKNSIHQFLFQMGKIHVHLEDLFMYQLVDVFSQYTARVTSRDQYTARVTSRDQYTARVISRDLITSHVTPSPVAAPSHMPAVVLSLMSELYEPLAVNLFSISDIDIELGVHASVKLFLAADQIPLKFKQFRVKKLFTLTEHFSQVILAKYASDTILQAGWALASLDLLGSPGLMIRSTLTGVRDLVYLPYEGLTRGPTAFVSGIAAGSASLARNIGTGVITSVTNLAVSISRNMDRMSLDEGHRSLCAIHRRSYKASHFGSGLSKGLTGLGLHLLSAVAGLVHQPIQDIGESEGIVGATRGLVTGVSKGLVGMVTKPLGGAAEFVANTGEGLLTGAGWTLAPNPLVPDLNQLLKSDTRLRVALELLQLKTGDDIHLVQCTVTPILIYVVISTDKIFLLLDSIIQCFNRSSVRFVFEQSNVAIYCPENKEEEGSKLDKSLLAKINKMYNLPSETSPPDSSSDLIATLPLDFPKSVLLKNLLSRY